MSTIADWYHRLCDLGYMADLLPVIPPGATLAQDTPKDVMVGKAPGQRYANGTWGLLKRWQHMGVGNDEIARFIGWGGNIGLNTRHFPAIDIDDDHAETAIEITRVIRRRLGDAPMRTRSNSPRRMLLCRTPRNTTASGKRRLSWVYPDKSVGKIEILGFGQQVVIAGMHPSGVSYQWDGRPLTAIAASTLPELSDEDGAMIIAEVAALLNDYELTLLPAVREGTGLGLFGSDRRLPLGHASMVAEDYEQAGRALLTIPNTPVLADGSANRHTATHDDALAIAAAFIGAVGGDGEAIEAYLLPWYQQWPDVTRSYVEQRIASFRDGTSVGAERLFSCARSWGFDEVPAGTFVKIDPPFAAIREVMLEQAAMQQATLQRAMAVNLTAPDALTDQRLAAEFYQHNKGRVAYRGDGRWFVWRPPVWCEDDDVLLHEIRLFNNARGRMLEGKNVERELRWLEDARRARAVQDVLRGLALIERWQIGPPLLNTPAGVIDLRTGSLRPAEAEDHLTRCTPVAPETGTPELWLQAVEDIFKGIPEGAAMWRDWCAFGMTGMKIRDVALVLEASGANGKSLVQDVMVAVLGDTQAGGVRREGAQASVA
jgi:hypothetical protein